MPGYIGGVVSNKALMTKRSHRTVWICNAMFMYGYLRHNEGFTKSAAASHVISFFTLNAVRWLDNACIIASPTTLHDATLYLALYHRVAPHELDANIYKSSRDNAHVVYKRLYGIVNNTRHLLSDMDK